MRRFTWFFLASLAFLSLLSSPAYSANAPARDRFAPCHQYDADIAKAVSRWWGVYDYPLAWKAQLYQESLCNPRAVSPAGAKGLAQFMPATWRDMEARFGVRASAHSDIAIDYGAYFMAKQMRIWKAKRPQHERWRLGLTSYNAGAGNIIKAQTKCDGAALWSQIKYCLHLVTGRHASETKTYVTRIERWWQELAYDKPWEIAPGLRRDLDSRVIGDLKTRFNIIRFFNGRSWCTYWQPWLPEMITAWVSAEHCHQEMGGQTPPAIDADTVVTEPTSFDAVRYSIAKPSARPRAMIEGEEDGEGVFIVGYPAASGEPTLRRARVYFKRQFSASATYDKPAMIILIETPRRYVSGAAYEPVIGGMSGGGVFSLSYEPLGVLVTMNGQADLTKDGIPDSSADATTLREVWGMTQTEILN